MRRHRSSRLPTMVSSAISFRCCRSLRPNSRRQDTNLARGAAVMDVAVKSKQSNAAGMSSSVRKVGIIGAGQMGNGIAHVVSLAGYAVEMNDLKKEAVDKALATIRKNMTRQVSRSLITEGDMEAALKRITFAPSFKD